MHNAELMCRYATIKITLRYRFCSITVIFKIYPIFKFIFRQENTTIMHYAFCILHLIDLVQDQFICTKSACIIA